MHVTYSSIPPFTSVPDSVAAADCSIILACVRALRVLCLRSCCHPIKLNASATQSCLREATLLEAVEATGGRPQGWGSDVR